MAAQLSGVSTTPPSLVSSANLLRVHSNSSSRSLMKKLNKTGPSKGIASCELSSDQTIQSMKTGHSSSLDGFYLVQQIRGHLSMKQSVQKPVMNLNP